MRILKWVTLFLVLVPVDALAQNNTFLGTNANNASSSANPFPNINILPYVGATKYTTCNAALAVAGPSTATAVSSPHAGAACTIRAAQRVIDMRPGGTNAYTGSEILTGQITCKNFENIRCADQFAGSDFGAKINAADADLGSMPGEIWLSQLGGTTSSTAISISANHILRLIQGGTYTLSAAITLAASAGIAGPPSGMPPNSSSAPAIIKQGNSASLAVFITLNQQSFLRDITIDGNKSNNTTTVCVVGLGIRLDLQSTNIVNCPSHNIQLGSSGVNVAAAAQLSKVMSLNSGGSALFIQKTLDVTIDQSQFENAARYGIEGTDAGEVRLNNSDVGGNTLGGINATCTQAGLAAAVNAIAWNIWADQFGNNNGPDIYAVGTGPRACLYGWLIVGNSFIGPSATCGVGCTNTYDAIHLDSGGRNTVVGNYISNSLAGHVYRYMISTASTNLTELVDIISSNVIDGVAAGTGTYNLLPTTWYGWNQNFGTPGHTNKLSLDGSTSGSITHVAPAVAGSRTILEPAATGTLLVTGNGSSPIQTKRVPGCATGSFSFDVCDRVVIWTTAFPDTSYTAVCTGNAVRRGVPEIEGINISAAKTASTITVRTIALTAAAAQFTTIDCTAVHD